MSKRPVVHDVTSAQHVSASAGFLRRHPQHWKIKAAEVSGVRELKTSGYHSSHQNIRS